MDFLETMLFFLVLLLMASAVPALWIIKRKIYIWLPGYFKHKLKKTTSKQNGGPTDILFCLVDHYEPGWNKVDLSEERRRVDGWVEKYPEIMSSFKDFDGNFPKHSWFYPPHYYRREHLKKLVTLCAAGYGEIEMHLHHNRMEPFPDTSNTLRDKIKKCIEIYGEFGIFKTLINGKEEVRFAFIHGDWALDNSRDGYCGVNDEITILKELGCYADFTFPAYLMEAQPVTVNTIYYAKDDPAAPKSYNKGVPLKVGDRPWGDIMMIQGPLGFRWKGRKRAFIPSIEDGEISTNNPPTKERVDHWVQTDIHIEGNPSWKIVKVYTHGAALEEQKVLLGKQIVEMHKHLRERYNDGKKYRLHYVAARELYNIIKAAEAGKDGNPGNYRDFSIPPYQYVLS